MYNFYREGQFIKSLKCTHEEAISLIMSMLHNFHVIWTFLEVK